MNKVSNPYVPLSGWEDGFKEVAPYRKVRGAKHKLQTALKMKQKIDYYNRLHDTRKPTAFERFVLRCFAHILRYDHYLWLRSKFFRSVGHAD